jgi:hypothetical protein
LEGQVPSKNGIAIIATIFLQAKQVEIMEYRQCVKLGLAGFGAGTSDQFGPDVIPEHLVQPLVESFYKREGIGLFVTRVMNQKGTPYCIFHPVLMDFAEEVRWRILMRGILLGLQYQSRFKIRVFFDDPEVAAQDYDVMAATALDARMLAFAMSGGLDSKDTPMELGHVQLAITWTTVLESYE